MNERTQMVSEMASLLRWSETDLGDERAVIRKLNERWRCGDVVALYEDAIDAARAKGPTLKSIIGIGAASVAFIAVCLVGYIACPPGSF